MKTKTNTSNNHTGANNLWRARNRAGYDRKQASFLLGKSTSDEISRYERGLYPPNLPTALKLEIIYRMPVRLLFGELFERLRTEIEQLKRRNKSLFPADYWFPKSAEQLRQEEFCFYTDLVQDHAPTSSEIEAITKHLIALNNTINDYKQGRKPFEEDQLTR